MGNDIFDSEQSRSLESLMTESQKSKLKEAILKKLVEKREEEKNTASNSITESKEETPPTPLTGTEKYTSTIREHVSKKSDNRQKVIREKTDLLAGDESVTAAQLRQSNSDLWQRVQASLASLGGGGLGDRDVIALIKKYSAVNNLDSDDLAAIIPGVLDGLTTDEVPEGLINLYFTDQRVWQSLSSGDGISQINQGTGELTVDIDALFASVNWDSAFSDAFDSLQQLSTTDSLPEGTTNLYYTDSRVDAEIVSVVDSAYVNARVTFPDSIILNSTDSLAEGLVNFYYTDERVEALVDSAYVNDRVEFPDSIILNTTDSLAEGVNNLYYTTARNDADTEALVDSAYVNARVDFPESIILDTTDSLAEGTTNLYYTDGRVEALVDSAYVNARVEFPESIILDTTDSLAEGTTNLYYTDERVEALVDSAYVNARVDLSEIPDPLNSTDSLAEGSTNLYYTDQRVEDKIDDYVDSAFLADKIALDDLTDVTSPSPSSGEFLKYNGAQWVPATFDVDAGITFKGTINAVDSVAPAGPDNGDMYINIASGAADASWTGLTDVDSDMQLLWGSDQQSWFAVGGAGTPTGVQTVQEGVAISVDDTDAQNPAVSVNKTVTDTWYYTQDQVDSMFSSLPDSSEVKDIIDERIDSTQFVKLAGDTMTGDLTLSNDPTADLHAATKQYVDNLDTAFDSDEVVSIIDERIDSTQFVKLAGDTMTGDLTLPNDPTNALHAATKQYVDNIDASFDSDEVIDLIKELIDSTQFVKLAGDTMTGDLTLPNDPTLGLHAATKAYVDAALINALDSNGGVGSDTLTGTFVLKGGDTMTGPLISAGQPTVDAEFANKIYVDTQVASIDSGYINDRVEFPESVILRSTDSLPEGSSNLYYTDQRVEDKIDVYVDNAFLTGKIALDDLSDVTSASPSANEYLQYNGAQWVPAPIVADGGTAFKGTINAVDSDAPADPANGDMYINIASGAADASWTGLTNVDSDEQLVWGSDQQSWFSFGGAGATTGVVEVREGIAILVADSDQARPAVSVNKTVTDTWYYTQDSVDAKLDSEHAWNVTEHSRLDSDIAAGDALLSAALDSEHAWNLAEHAKLDSDINNLDVEVGDLATVELTDVDSTPAQHGQILMFDSDAGKYAPVDIEQAGGGVAHHDSVPPETPFTNGQFWFSTKTTSLYVWHVNAWIKIGL